MATALAAPPPWQCHHPLQRSSTRACQDCRGFSRSIWNWFDLVVVTVALISEIAVNVGSVLTLALFLRFIHSAYGEQRRRRAPAQTELSPTRSGLAQPRVPAQETQAEGLGQPPSLPQGRVVKRSLTLRAVAAVRCLESNALCCSFDIDITYITDRVLAMSVPAVGVEAVYRNPVAVRQATSRDIT